MRRLSFCLRRGVALLAVVTCFVAKGTRGIAVEAESKQAKALRDALNKRVSFDFQETPLEQIAKFLSDYTRITWAIDTVSFERAGLSEKAPVTSTLWDVRLDDAVALMAELNGLVLEVHEDAVVVRVGPPGAVIRVYPVADLALNGNSSGGTGLTTIVERAVRTQLWDWNGAEGVLEFHAPTLSLVASLPPRVQASVARLLEDLRAARLGPSHSQPSKVDKPAPSAAMVDRRATDLANATKGIAAVPDAAAMRRLEAGLEREVSFDFKGVPLRDVVRFCRDRGRINIVIDDRSVVDYGHETDPLVTLSLQNVSLREALAAITRSVGLTYTIRHHIVVVAASSRVEVTTRVYPVADLLATTKGRTVLRGAQLAAMVEKEIRRRLDDSDGGAGAVDYFAGARSLVVTQPPGGHESAKKALARLRRDRQLPVKQIGENAADRQGNEAVIRGLESRVSELEAEIRKLRKRTRGGA